MKKHQKLRKFIVIFLAIAMVGTMGILGSYKTIFNSEGKETMDNKSVTDKTESNDVAKTIKKQDKVVKSNVYIYGNTAVATVIVENNLTDKEMKKLQQKCEDSLKAAYSDKDIRIAISNKNGTEIDTNDNKSMPKASITILDTKIQYKTYVQVKLDTKEQSKYYVVINGKKLEQFVKKGTNEILFDATLNGTYEKNELAPIVFKLN